MTDHFKAPSTLQKADKSTILSIINAIKSHLISKKHQDIKPIRIEPKFDKTDLRRIRITKPLWTNSP